MILLGSTGSIGTSTLDVARRFRLEVEVLVAGRNAALLQQQIDEFKPRIVVAGDQETANLLRHPDIRVGKEAIPGALEEAESSLVVNALVGFLGLRPTLKALELGKTLALANKESLVAAGKFIDTSAIRAVDSEHFGLSYLMDGKKIRRFLITASGGAFRDWPVEKIPTATLEEVLKHPNWAMGQKITIDSATMMNKLFELLEARWLFKDRFARGAELDAIVETKSVVHALIDFADGSTTAHLARADMRLPIAFGVLGKTEEPILEPVDLTALGSLEFRTIDPERYPAWRAKERLLERPELGTVANAANEGAIARFLAGETDFGAIGETVMKAVETFADADPATIDDVFAIDREVRAWCTTI